MSNNMPTSNVSQKEDTDHNPTTAELVPSHDAEEPADHLGSDYNPTTAELEPSNGAGEPVDHLGSDHNHTTTELEASNGAEEQSIVEKAAGALAVIVPLVVAVAGFVLNERRSEAQHAQEMKQKRQYHAKEMKEKRQHIGALRMDNLGRLGELKENGHICSGTYHREKDYINDQSGSDSDSEYY